MIFEQVATGGCQSYLLGCETSHAALLIDPEFSRIDHYRALTAQLGLRVHYVVDTHTHADHFSASRELGRALGAPVVTHRLSPAPYPDMRLDDGDMLIAGDLRLRALHTPGHTRDSMSLAMDDRVFTGDALLIGGTGRTDLPTGDPHALHESLFEKLLKLDAATMVFPAHDYKGRSHSTIGAEIADNPRLQKTERGEFVQMMQALDLSAPTHLTEALRTNMSGGKTVNQLLAEAASRTPFMAMAELASRIGANSRDLVCSTCARRRRSRPAPSPAPATCRAASWSCGSTPSSPTRPCASSPAASSARSRPWRRPRCAISASSAPPRSTAG